jgi:hypothetical protein
MSRWRAVVGQQRRGLARTGLVHIGQAGGHFEMLGFSCGGLAGRGGCHGVVTSGAKHGGTEGDTFGRFLQVIPEGAGPVKTNLCVVLVRSASFLVLAERVEVGVGVKARAEPDRVAAVGP